MCDTSRPANVLLLYVISLTRRYIYIC